MSIRIGQCVSMRWLRMLRRRCRRACLVILCRPSLVFGADNLADWHEVTGYFPVVGQLDTPWRWINAGAEPLGRWLLEVREKLLRGEPIDLRRAPAGVIWVELDGSNDHAKRLAAARIRAPGEDPCVLIIGDSTNPASQHHFASQTPGAVTVEAVDLRVWSRSRGGSISRLRPRLISLRRSLKASWPMWGQRISWLRSAP